MLTYEAPGGAKTTFEYQQKKLQELGWKELPERISSAANTSSKSPRTGSSSPSPPRMSPKIRKKPAGSRVYIMNHGNVLTAQIAGAPGRPKPFHPDVTQASYITEAKIAETAAAVPQVAARCRVGTVRLGGQSGIADDVLQAERHPTAGVDFGCSGRGRQDADR